MKRVRNLFCKNERALIRTRLQEGGHLVTLVPVAAILVAGIRLRFLDIIVDPRRTTHAIPCQVPFRKGEEMGWFEHGSTIIVLAPEHFEFCDSVVESARIRAGQPLMRSILSQQF